jgi:hypothetical protein
MDSWIEIHKTKVKNKSNMGDDFEFHLKSFSWSPIFINY